MLWKFALVRKILKSNETENEGVEEIESRGNELLMS
jgi:hypothetical protein